MSRSSISLHKFFRPQLRVQGVPIFCWDRILQSTILECTRRRMLRSFCKAAPTRMVSVSANWETAVRAACQLGRQLLAYLASERICSVIPEKRERQSRTLWMGSTKQSIRMSPVR